MFYYVCFSLWDAMDYTDKANRLRVILQEIEDDYGNPSKRELNAKTGLNYTAFDNWKKGISFPSLSSMEAIAEVKGWSLNDLLLFLDTGTRPGEAPQITEEQVVKFLGSLSPEEKMRILGRVLS